MMCGRRALALSMLLLLALGLSDASAQEASRISFVIGSGVGGGYDAYSRLLANHIGRHLPGQPAVVAQNMPGAGSLRATNYLYNEAPKDGSVIGMIDQAIYFNQILGAPQLKADATKFGWVGRLASNHPVMFGWHAAPAKSIEDVRSKPMVIATSGTASRLYILLLNNQLGFKFKLIKGYEGTADSRLAMERGEVDALVMPWPVLKAEAGPWLAQKKINLILQTGSEGDAELAHVPLMIDLGRDDGERRLLQLFASPSTIGRSVLAPPGLAPERLAVLRRAFMATMADAAFRADIARAQLDLDPLSGEALQDAIAGKSDLAPELVAQARRIAEMDAQGGN
jgi:tripartite-type tricarboxylate transporter receptor subunit TctC